MTRLYTSGGARLAFDDTGTGLPVIFLHPTPLDGDFWRPLVADLPGVRSIVPDLRGHGSSELGPDLPVGEFARVPDAPAITMARYAADVLALLIISACPTPSSRAVPSAATSCWNSGVRRRSVYAGWLLSAPSPKPMLKPISSNELPRLPRRAQERRLRCLMAWRSLSLA